MKKQSQMTKTLNIYFFKLIFPPTTLFHLNKSSYSIKAVRDIF